MKCPQCGNEMENGILQTPGNNLIWDTKRHNFLILPSKNGIQLAYRPLGAYLNNASRCKNCRIILFPYNE